MRLALPLSILLAFAVSAPAEPTLPEAPSAIRFASVPPAPTNSRLSLLLIAPADSLARIDESSSLALVAINAHNLAALNLGLDPQAPGTIRKTTGPVPPGDVDRNGNPIPIEQQQPKRILGFMPNFRSVSGGSVPPPPTFRNNFRIATRQAFDYSSFFFLGLTSISAQALNEHPVLGKGVPGFWGYTWRGFLDKTDGTYLSAWLLPSLLREDTRFYALGYGTVLHRSLYVISRQAVARTYGGRQTPNISGLGGKVLTQVISRYYYPTGSSSFGTLAEKFGYATMRDVAFTSIREFYPTIAAHYIRQHRAKIAAQSARDARTIP